MAGMRAGGGDNGGGIRGEKRRDISISVLQMDLFCASMLSWPIPHRGEREACLTDSRNSGSDSPESFSSSGEWCFVQNKNSHSFDFIARLQTFFNVMPSQRACLPTVSAHAWRYSTLETHWVVPHHQESGQERSR